jgi:hypothetical protein
LQRYAVGWLERRGFPRGKGPNACVEAVVAAHRGGIFSDGTRGIHGCTLCGRELPQVRWFWPWRMVQLKGHGHYLVRRDDAVFMAPELLLHYIRRHGYCPPQEFVDAVTHRRFLTVDDLEIRWRGATMK